MNTRRQRLTVAAAAAGLALGAVGAGVLQASAASATPSTVAHSSPAGNAGTIKVNNLPLGSTPRNEPHLTCDLAVSFYGYAGGSRTAELTFEAQPPTVPATGSRVILHDTFTFTGGKGGSTLDATTTYRLDVSGLPQQPKQGVHVKLTVHVPGTKGADVKHKVFWVQPCVTTPGPTPSPTPTTPEPTPTTPAPTPSSPAPTPSMTSPAPTPTTSAPAPTPSPSSTVGVPVPTPSTSGPSTSGTGTCTGAAAGSPDCTTVSGAPHFTG